MRSSCGASPSGVWDDPTPDWNQALRLTPETIANDGKPLASREARERLIAQTAANLQAFLDGQPVNGV